MCRAIIYALLLELFACDYRMLGFYRLSVNETRLVGQSPLPLAEKSAVDVGNWTVYTGSGILVPI